MLLRGLILSAALLAAPAFAQSDDRNSLTVGVGVATTSDYEGSNDYRLVPAGLVMGKVAGFDFYSRGTSLYFDLIPGESANGVDFAIGPAGNVRVDRTSVKDDRVELLGELDWAIELGGFVGIGKRGVFHQYDLAAARIHYVRDIADTHDSYVISPTIEYGTPLSRTTFVGVAASAEYVGGKYASTYFAVDPAGAARSGLPVFANPGSGWKNARFTLLGTQMLTGDLEAGGLSLFGLASYSSLLGDFKDSPLVSVAGDADQWFVGAGLAYSF